MFFITLFDIRHITKNRKIPRARRIGYLATKQQALAELTTRVDLNPRQENEYAVIEKVAAGVCPKTIVEGWFLFNPKNNKYEKCEPPEWSSDVKNWAIG